ncbi:MAG: DUF3667 domain-containing protein [Balneola sp.]|nr:DUF3667 domain-containing protein [Balneola sp.]MBO6651452.1 DUF3667 domain-containing protein [Balneola sp.]MBO6712511.1 DUF3667 domain-containing protein [Balneola sp.]MBO6800996.1 DUF3667 domain-containing protein [Balneola sp.]MBO6870668.1 DUF3667 domain-containing protein [Balneola sp.]
MSGHLDTIPDNHCLNCNEPVSGNYCSNCGQKFQPTKLPLRKYLEDTVETLFNVDNRVFKTLKDLFLRPGKITKEYISGHRATYLPPLRIYISISILYFFLAIITESTQVFLVNLSADQYDSSFGKLIQTSMFVLVPLFALITKWHHKKRKGYYVEYLIFSLHIHSVWFVLLSFSIITTWAHSFFGIQEGSFFDYLAATIQILERSLFMIYFIVYLKRVFDNTWWKTILKTFGILFLYLITLLAVIAPYLYIMYKDS